MSNLTYIKSQLLPDEKIVCIGKVHWQIFLLPIILTMLFILVAPRAIFLIFVMPSAMLHTNGFIVAIFLIVITSWIVKFLQKISIELALTNQRVIAKFGFIRRYTYEFQLSKVEGLNFEQTVINRLLGCGSIIIRGIGGDASPIPYISNYNEFKLTFQKLVTDKERDPDYIKCPVCAEDIKLDAKKCKHCNELLSLA